MFTLDTAKPAPAGRVNGVNVRTRWFVLEEDEIRRLQWASVDSMVHQWLTRQIRWFRGGLSAFRGGKITRICDSTPVVFGQETLSGKIASVEGSDCATRKRWKHPRHLPVTSFAFQWVPCDILKKAVLFRQMALFRVIPESDFLRDVSLHQEATTYASAKRLVKRELRHLRIQASFFFDFARDSPFGCFAAFDSATGKRPVRTRGSSMENHQDVLVSQNRRANSHHHVPAVCSKTEL